jgi:hypothetical protein
MELIFIVSKLTLENALIFEFALDNEIIGGSSSENNKIALLSL